MSDKEDGGSSFPVASEVIGRCEGMTLRDYFAAHTPIGADDLSVPVAEALMGEAMPKLPAASVDRVKWWTLAEARYKYMCADAMIEARK